MNNELIILRQLPVIEEHLRVMQLEIQEKVDCALALECTEESRAEVKKVRAGLRRDLEEFEERRKDVKNKILDPYKKFEAAYVENISVPFRDGIAELDTKIRAVEDGIKTEKRTKLRDFFNEYARSVGIDFLTLEDAEINVTLSASDKALREAAKRFIDRVMEDISYISEQESADEVLVEYRRNFNLSEALRTVQDRKKAIDNMRAERERTENLISEAETAEEKVDQVIAELKPPEERENKEKTLEVTFTVRGTRERLRELKKFLENGGYDYE